MCCTQIEAAHLYAVEQFAMLLSLSNKIFLGIKDLNLCVFIAAEAQLLLEQISVYAKYFVVSLLLGL